MTLPLEQKNRGTNSDWGRAQQKVACVLEPALDAVMKQLGRMTNCEEKYFSHYETADIGRAPS